MRIILIGGSGFIGNNLSVQLLEQGYKVIVYDVRKTILPNSNKFKFIEGKIEETEKLFSIIKEGDCVIHLASTSVPNNSNRNFYLDTYNNILPMLDLLQICIEKKVGKIIFPSSGGSVYGIPNYVPIDELHKTEPNSSYGIQKLAIENYMRLVNKLHNIQTICLRISNPYGPGQRPFMGQGVIATFLASVLLEKPIEIWGDGSAVRDYIYIDDLCMAFKQAIEYVGDERIFNVGSGVGNSIEDILLIIEKVTNKTIIKLYRNESEVEVMRNILDCNKALNEFAWKATINLEEGILKMLESWDEQKKQFI